MAQRFYTLLGRVAVPCRNLVIWSEWFASADRTVASTLVGATRVSTVFIGIDNDAFSRDPMVFETATLTGLDCFIEGRTATWDEAEKLHAITVERVRALQNQ